MTKYSSANQTSSSGRGQKVYLANVTYSWNRFTDTIHQVLKAEWFNKQQDINGYWCYLSDRFGFLSPKLLLISFLPMASYLIIFQSYTVLKDVLHLPTQPHTILPVVEYNLFHCLPHQILSRRYNTVFDVLAAIPYTIHFILPVLFILYNVLVRKRQAVPLIYQYLWCCGWTNIIAVCIQFLFPTAPPWFNDSAVFDEWTGEVIHAMPNEAAFQRIDALIGFPWFKNIYGKSPLKFGSFPSLHVAWPAVLLVHRPWINVKVGIFHVLWIIWAALYSSHHYLFDALGGICIVMCVKLGMCHIWEPFSSCCAEPPKTPRSYTRLLSCSKAV